MRVGGVDEIEIICRRLPLKHVAIIKQDKVFAIFFAFLLNERSNSSHAAFPLRVSYEIVRKAISVNVGGVHHFDFHDAILGKRCVGNRKQCNHCDEKYLFHL